MTTDVQVVTVRQLEQMLASQSRLRKHSDALAAQARKELERVAEAVCSRRVNQMRQADPRGLAVLSVSELADLIIRSAAMGEGEGEIDREVEITAIEANEPELEGVQGKWFEFEDDAPPAKEVESAPPPTQARDGIRPPEQKIPPWLGPVEPFGIPHTPFESWPAWTQDWCASKDNVFNRNRDLILALGDTGAPTRYDLLNMLGELWGVRGGGGTTRAYERAKELGVIELVIPAPEAQWKPGHLVQLTERGRDIYYLLRGRPPVESHAARLLKRHKSPEHTQLNLEAARMLWEAGGDVDLYPDAIELPLEAGGGRSEPDLLVIMNGVRMLVECERDTEKNAPDRARKWDKYYRASQGHFYIVTPTAAASEAIEKEIEAWAISAGRSIELWASNLAQGRGITGDGVWLVKRVVGTSGYKG